MTVRFALDDLAVAVFVLDADNRVQAANTAAGELVGTTAQALVGRPLGEVLVEESRGPGTTIGVGEVAMLLRCADGREVPVLTRSRPASGPRTAGPTRLLVVSPLDTTNNGPALVGPSGMEVISTVSHELRSPLTSVKGYTSLLLSRWDRLGDDQKKAMLEQVHHDADRVTRLVNELLDISRLETGHLQLRFQPVALPGIARSVVEKLCLEYPDLDCGVDFAEGFPAVRADPDKVEQVLTNLVENAAKYASLKGMAVSGAVAGDSVAVAVADTGEGIPPADLPHIFTKFYRRDQGRPSGSGLGLWISRGLVEAHGGRLDAQSVVGQGSVFRFTLPLDRDGNDD